MSNFKGLAYDIGVVVGHVGGCRQMSLSGAGGPRGDPREEAEIPKFFRITPDESALASNSLLD